MFIHSGTMKLEILISFIFYGLISLKKVLSDYSEVNKVGNAACSKDLGWNENGWLTAKQKCESLCTDGSCTRINNSGAHICTCNDCSANFKKTNSTVFLHRGKISNLCWDEKILEICLAPEYIFCKSKFEDRGQCLKCPEYINQTKLKILNESIPIMIMPIIIEEFPPSLMEVKQKPKEISWELENKPGNDACTNNLGFNKNGWLTSRDRCETQCRDGGCDNISFPGTYSCTCNNCSGDLNADDILSLTLYLSQENLPFDCATIVDLEICDDNEFIYCENEDRNICVKCPQEISSVKLNLGQKISPVPNQSVQPSRLEKSFNKLGQIVRKIFKLVEPKEKIIDQIDY